MTWSTGWPAPAKINRFLHVVGRRADGYHLLQTAFQFLDRCDRLAFRVTNDGAVAREGDVAGVTDADDLTVRAARALQSEGRIRQGVRIRVDKRIPIGGGLGGGSSDAATTLVALNRLWNIGLDRERLAGLALGLGADVPVFVGGQAAWAEGIGERLTPVTLDRPWYLVVDPGVAVATARVFAAMQLTHPTPRITIRRLATGETRNDCEPTVRALFPEVGRALDWLAAFGEVRMTGTGGCLYVPCVLREEAERILARLPQRWSGFVARGLNESPLLTTDAVIQTCD